MSAEGADPCDKLAFRKEKMMMKKKDAEVWEDQRSMRTVIPSYKNEKNVNLLN